MPVVIPLVALAMGTFVAFWYDAPRAGHRFVTDLGMRTGLRVDHDTADLVSRRGRRRMRAIAMGFLIGALAGTVPGLVVGGLGQEIVWWVAGAAAGSGAGPLVVHVRDIARITVEPGPRAAVLRPRRLLDFLTPFELGAPYLGLLLPAWALVVVLVSGQAEPVGSAGTAWVVTGAALAVVVTVVAVAARRFVLHIAPPSRSTIRLTWEDAMRGVALRDIGATAVGTSWALGGLAAFQVAVTWPVELPLPLVGATVLIFGAATGLLAALVVNAEGRQGPTRRFLRLYDDNAAVTGGPP